MIIPVPTFQGKVCPACWRGSLRGGGCPVCNYNEKKEASRRTDALPLGTVIRNRYTIGDVLGNGGFGITYSVWDSVRQCRLALKEFYPRNEVLREEDHLTVTPVSGEEKLVTELRGRFEREASLLLKLQNDRNVINVYDMFICNGTAYYAMEFLEGCDLKSYLSHYGPLPWETLESLLRELLPAIAQLHRHNLIHRDISPDNLFLTTDHHIRLIDFGSVRAYEGNHNFTVHVKDHFAPWEQYISDGNQGPWTDIYALSVTLYMLLSGKLPPKAGERKNGAQVIPLQTLVPSIPPYAAQAIEKGMALQIEQRLQSAEQMMAALQIQPAQLVTPVRPAAKESRRSEQRPPQAIGVKGTFWLVGCSGYFKEKRYLMPVGGEILAGRAPECQILFPDQTRGVSRRQCTFFIRGDGVLFVRDAGSTYGTFLNGQRLIRSWTPVRQGDLIRFGNESFRFIYQRVSG